MKIIFPKSNIIFNMKFLNLPKESINLIFEFDSTYKIIFKEKVLREYMELFSEYEDQFYKNHLLSCNVYAVDDNVKEWLSNY